MADVINLRQVRKAKARMAAADTAAQNRARHGRSKAERASQNAQADRAARLLDGAKREDD
ncbi:DUF4169 family protein [Novosphingobium sp.]|uniref:DUF4169 family protein n=1 Tax=Novosphingobium sp. TaxID=1874826 RepID=UPI0025F81809|nr:DUF4169 family protein [Novosphingobium sp.]